MIFVTGASGRLGSEIVRGLYSMGAPFRAGYHSAEKAARARSTGIATVLLEYSNPASIARAMQGVHGLFLVCPAHQRLVDFETNLIDEAKKAGVQRIVKCSVWGAEDEGFEFARLHRQSERLIEDSGLQFVFLRSNSYMQNVSTYFASTIRSRSSFYIPARDSIFSLVDVRDIAEVAVRALTDRTLVNRAVALSGPQPLSYGDVAMKLSAALGREVHYKDISEEEYRQLTLSFGGSAWLAEAMIDLYKYYWSTGRGAAVSPAIQEILGHPPRSFDQFVQDYIDIFHTDMQLPA